jgi:hypothetical protein|tara:strand:+ start:1950 stop:3605 length:1656 start_codon:yes stop_codon:yes gene_type:complete
MAGGLLNIVSTGNNNLFLTGNPVKSFFKVTYAKYTNFGLQKFRIDYNGLRELRPSEDSIFTFKMPRYAELLMDTYIVVTIPDIWSPIHSPITETSDRWAPYEFKWIENLGTHMIKEITINCGGLMLQRYTGEYLHAMMERDFSEEKKKLFYTMIGHVPEFTDPAYAQDRNNAYPNAMYTESTTGAEPSIRGRNLYIPINTWFTLNSSCAFPLVALQYNELSITVTMRPIQDLFQVRDVFDYSYGFPYVRPDFNETRFQMYRFLQTPPSGYVFPEDYENKVNTWNADVHLISTYCFLSKEETQKFASQDQVYLVKDIFEHKYENITGTKKLKVETNGMISSWMWYLQRNDVNLRNEWSNYTNWPYNNVPGNVTLADITPIAGTEATLEYGPGLHPTSKQNTGITITGDYKPDNHKPILESMAILLNGEYRENLMVSGVYNYIEKYVRTPGNAKEGIYCYNFCLNTSPFTYQPSGAINMSKFKNIEIELVTYIPNVDPLNSNYNVICSEDGDLIGIKKSNWRLYEYNYNLTLFEERQNVLSFIGGNCGMMHAR